MVDIKVRNGEGSHIDIDVKSCGVELITYAAELERAVYEILIELEKAIDYPYLHVDFIEILSERFK